MTHAPRLFFLYPALLRTVYRQSGRRGVATYVQQRHGTAVDPSAVGGKKVEEVEKDDGAASTTAFSPSDSPSALHKEKLDAPATSEFPTASETTGSTTQDSTSPSPSVELTNFKAPLEDDENGTKYHFDTYAQLQTLQKTFTPKQSSIIISALQDRLQNGLHNASDVLLSRSRTENDSYLFQAACSELRAEIESLRRRHTEEMRIQRASAKAEFDSINMAFAQEIAEYKNALRGMFDERKMEVRAEQRAMENKIQELNYKITVMIQSECKSEVEGLRWITTRRGLLAIATLAVFIVLGIKLNTKPKEKKKPEGPPEGTPFAGVVGLG